jgi:hypothetical protein
MPELKSEFAEFAADAAFSKPEFAKLPIDAAFFKPEFVKLSIDAIFSKPEFVKLPINAVFLKPEHSGGTIKTQHKFSWLSRAIRFSTGPAGNQEPRGGG